MPGINPRPTLHAAVEVHYQNGERFPSLVREPKDKDLLSDLVAPHAVY
jgi:hypothetical protein